MGKLNSIGFEGQLEHWNKSFTAIKHMFGQNPSSPALFAAEAFKLAGAERILELGSGQGRDTLHFARQGFQVHALDYSNAGFQAIETAAIEQGVVKNIFTLQHDARNNLPFNDGTIDAVYAHMLLCMALSTPQIEFICSEAHRVLKHGGMLIYTVRNHNDPDYGSGIALGEDMYEQNGFIVHFFNRDKVLTLAKRFELLEISEFEEGQLPRRLYQVVLRKA
jgi:SAM-dependent methyltransferase